MQEPLRTTGATADRRSARETAMLQAAVTAAMAALNAGDGDGAVAALTARAELARRDPLASHLFGLIHMNAGALEPAMAWFEHALELQPDHPQATAGRAVVLHRLGRSQEALICYQAVMAAHPEDAEAAYMCGALLQALGRADEAIGAYGAALRRRPAYAEALINRGALLEREGRLPEALRDFDAAAAARPDDATVAFNRGAVLQRLGRHKEALAAFDAARRAGPDAELACNRGNVLQKLGRPDEALADYDEALALRPAYPQAHYNRAIALQALGQLDAALGAYDAALALDPGYAEALCNRGNALHELGRPDAALASYDAALALKPGLAAAHVSRATVLLTRGHHDAAILACDTVLREQPDHAQALCLKGAAHHLKGDFRQALVALDAALMAAPHYPEALLNRGNALQELDRLDEALLAYDAALACRPNYPEALSGRGVALKKRGDIDAAGEAFDEALRLKPSFSDARNNRAGVHLIKGRLAEGFADYESRWLRSDAPRKLLQADFPAWRGERLSGRLVVFDEQGAGDLIQFVRYLPRAAAAAGTRVTFLCRRSMHRLLARDFADIEIVDCLTPDDHFAAQAALMSLPHILGTRLETIPAPVPYLHAEPERIAHWSAVIGTQGFRIGVCSAGNMVIDPHRSIPLSRFQPIAALPGVRLISLMKEPPRGLRSANVPIENLGANFDAGPDAFIDSAAVIANLDLVISCDTAIAHLAGALGRPAFLALKHAPDWRWLMERVDSPWYPTLRLFRQPAPHDWEAPFADMTNAVAGQIAARQSATPLVIPAAVGELIDKITILEIKATAITDAEKLANVRQELDLLRTLRRERGLDGAALAVLEQNLKCVNATLWDIEDELRVHEDRQDFGARFVELARLVYKTNDRRAALKRDINRLFNSAIVEEKSYTPYAGHA